MITVGCGGNFSIGNRESNELFRENNLKSFDRDYSLYFRLDPSSFEPTYFRIIQNKRPDILSSS